MAVEPRGDLASGGRGLGAELGGDERGLQPAEVVHELAAGDRLAVGAADGDSGTVQSAGDQRRRVVLVDDVGGVQAGHLRGDRLDRVLARGRPQRRLDLLGDVRDRVAAHLEGEHEVGLGRLHLTGDALLLGLVELGLRGHPRLVDRALKTADVAGGAAGEELEEVHACFIGLLDQGGDVVRVVLERAVARADLAAVDAEHDQDQHDQQHPGGDGATDLNRLMLGGGPAATTGGTTSTRGCLRSGTRLIRLVEERQASRSLKVVKASV